MEFVFLLLGLVAGSAIGWGLRNVTIKSKLGKRKYEELKNRLKNRMK